MDRGKHVCPDCGQPVESVVRRHRTLGAWVPKWVPGPCRNPECAAYAEGGEHEHQHPHTTEPAEPAASAESAGTTEPAGNKADRMPGPTAG
jgi:hypothetical protein